MKNSILFLVLFLLTPFISSSQQIEDLFQKSDTKITWLGIDFSHVKLIGDFNQIWGIANEGPISLKNDYFPAWNNMIYSEANKYDIAAMLRKENIVLNTDDIDVINKKSAVEEMEGKVDPNYTKEDIQQFIKTHSFKEKEGLGVLLVAESLNKYKEYAKYHFVVIDMKNNSILLHELLIEKAGGFGLRNYWAKTFFNAINDIKNNYYSKWKKAYLK